MHTGCCKHPAKCCGIVGRGADCKGTAFYGDPADCCLRNSIFIKGGYTDNSQCQDGKGFTCSGGQNRMPDHRTLTGMGCKQPMWDYFTGTHVDIGTTITRWMEVGERSVLHFIARVIHTGSNCAEDVDSLQYGPDREGIVYASSLIRRFVERFNAEAKPRHIPSERWSDGYHMVQEVLYELAQKHPAVVNGVLCDICSSMGVNDLEASADLNRWCGCHLDSAMYDPYERQYGIKKECSPMCTFNGAIPAIDDEGESAACKQSVCIVNNVGVKTSMSRVRNVNISQICNHCKTKDSCRCVVDGIRITVNASEIDGSLKAVQELCSDTMCTVEDPVDPTKKVNIPCSGPAIVYYRYQQGLRVKDQRESTMALSICFVFVCVLLMIIILRRC